MRNFAYSRALAPEEAARAAAQHGAVFLAGGTELLNWMRLGVMEPERVLDISRAEALKGVRQEGEALVIGALATLAEIGEHPLVRTRAPVLAQACLKAASAQIRNRATLGGNVLQKTRCAYFRAEAPLPWPCNKRTPGSGCAAIDGHHERHAIFGWTEACVATQPSDPAVALACLDAIVETLGAEGRRRTIPMTAFHLTQQDAARLVAAGGRPAAAAKGGEAQIETGLGEGELITAFRLPLGAAARRSAYVKVRERESYEYAMVSAAAAVEIEGGAIRRAALALGGVAQKPWRLEAAEQALAGHRLDREALRRIVAAGMQDARPLPHNGFKTRLAVNAAVRAIELAGGAA